MLFLFSLLSLNTTASPLLLISTPEDAAKVIANEGVRNVQALPWRDRGRYPDLPLSAQFNVESLWPTVVFQAGRFQGSETWNWGGSTTLEFNLTNPNSIDLPVTIRMDNPSNQSGNGYTPWDQRSLTLPAYSTKAISFLIEEDPLSQMRVRRTYLPGQSDGLLLRSPDYFIDRTRVNQFMVFISNPVSLRDNSSPWKEIIIDDFALNYLNLFSERGAWIDRYGQNIRVNWQRKVTSDAELRRDAQRQNPSTSERVPGIGDWENGPSLSPSRAFRTEERNGKWWLVSPRGRLFFSTGVTGISTSMNTVVRTQNSADQSHPWLTARETLFQWLPETREPNGAYLGALWNYVTREGDPAQVFNFFAMNLFRKYSATGVSDCQTGLNPTAPDARFCPSIAAWSQNTLSRLRDWELNTLGAWYDPPFSTLPNTLPYTSILETYWGQPNHMSRKMIDVFANGATAQIQESIRHGMSEQPCDSLCIGRFVDNELDFGSYDSDPYSLVFEVLSQTSGAKDALTDDLMARYQSIQALTRAWEQLANITSWQMFRSTNLLPSLTSRTQLSPAMRSDLSAFLARFARTYFQTVRTQLKSIDPDHLYLCSRFAMSAPIEVLTEAFQACDVVSLNVYTLGIDSSWSYLGEVERAASIYRKPILIGEFQFASPDEGAFAFGVNQASGARNQVERGSLYSNYMRSAFTHPLVVGAHVFEMVDQPHTGRLDDYENYAVGLVSVTDRPHEAYVSAVRNINRDRYVIRSGNSR